MENEKGKKQNEMQKIVTLEDAEKLVPKIPMQAIVFIVGGAALFAAICFLLRKGKRNNQRNMEEETQHRYTELPVFGGNLA